MFSSENLLKTLNNNEQNVGDFTDTCIANLRFGSQSDEFPDFLLRKYTSYTFFFSSFALILLKFGYFILEYIIFYPRTKLIFLISFLSPFSNPPPLYKITYSGNLVDTLVRQWKNLMRHYNNLIIQT